MLFNRVVQIEEMSVGICIKKVQTGEIHGRNLSPGENEEYLILYNKGGPKTCKRVGVSLTIKTLSLL